MTNEQQPDANELAVNIPIPVLLEALQIAECEADRISSETQGAAAAQDKREYYRALQRAEFLDALRDFESAGYQLLNAWGKLGDEDNDATMNGYPLGHDFHEVLAEWGGYREGLEVAFGGPAGRDH